MGSTSALVDKAAPDPLPPKQDGDEALLDVSKGYQAQGVPDREAYDRAAHEHPTWYAKYCHEARGAKIRPRNIGTLTTPSSVQYQCLSMVECMNLMWTDLGGGAVPERQVLASDSV